MKQLLDLQMGRQRQQCYVRNSGVSATARGKAGVKVLSQEE